MIILFNIIASLMVIGEIYLIYSTLKKYGNMFPGLAAFYAVLMTVANGLIIWLVLKLNGLII